MGFCMILGTLPFVIGGIQNWYMLSDGDVVLPYSWIGVCFLLIWGGIGFLLNGKGRGTKKTVIALNLIAFVDLLLLGMQELVLHAYWMNRVGSWSQLFYLPMVNLGATLTSWSHSMFAVYIISFLLMVGATFIGCKLREKR